MTSFSEINLVDFISLLSNSVNCPQKKVLALKFEGNVTYVWALHIFELWIYYY